MRKWVVAAACAALALPLLAQTRQGVDLFEQGRYEEAKRILAASPNDAEAVATLGRIALRQNDPEQAVELLEKAVGLRPSVARYHFHLGEAMGAYAQKASFFKQAAMAPKIRKAFERASELDPNYLEPRFGLIDFYLIAPGVMGGSEEKAFEQAAEIRNRDPFMGAQAYARIYTRQKKNDLVRKEWLDLVRQHPRSPRAHNALARYLGMSEKKFREAFEAIDKALELDPGYMPAYFRAGQIAAESGAHLARGEESLRKYLGYTPKDNEPDLASAHFYLGMVYEKQGKKAEARASFGNAVRLNPSVRAFKEALKRVS